MTTAPRYQIIEIIGRGGMGQVCLADDVMLDRKVALKFVTEPDESDGLDQLLIEARAAAALDHPAAQPRAHRFDLSVTGGSAKDQE